MLDSTQVITSGLRDGYVKTQTADLEAFALQGLS